MMEFVTILPEHLFITPLAQVTFPNRSLVARCSFFTQKSKHKSAGTKSSLAFN
jgi:hypothetical protein